MSFYAAVSLYAERLRGEKVSVDDIDDARQALPFVPGWYWEIMRDFKLSGHEFEIDPEIDLSGLGGLLRWLSPSETVEEAAEFYPGIIASKEKYFPVAECMEGSGDPYFLSSERGDDPELVRLQHDATSVKKGAHVVLNKVSRLMPE